MKEQSLVSIIIPSYNSGKFLNEAIESVVGQTYRNLEIIIVNDGSVDETEETAKKWQKEDKRVKYLKHSANKGLPAARNTGIQNSKGEYIAFLDADDIWLPQKIEIQMKEIRNSGADLIFSNWYIWESEKKAKFRELEYSPNQNTTKDLLAIFIKKNLGNPSTAFLKKSSLEKVGLFDEGLKSSEDYDLWLRFLLKGMKVVFCNESLIYSRRHLGQMTVNTYKMRTSRLTVFKKIAQQKPKTLIQYPILFKKIFLLQGYKFVQDFLKILKIKHND